MIQMLRRVTLSRAVLRAVSAAAIASALLSAPTHAAPIIYDVRSPYFLNSLTGTISLDGEIQGGKSVRVEEFSLSGRVSEVQRCAPHTACPIPFILGYKLELDRQQESTLNLREIGGVLHPSGLIHLTLTIASLALSSLLTVNMDLEVGEFSAILMKEEGTGCGLFPPLPPCRYAPLDNLISDLRLEYDGLPRFPGGIPDGFPDVWFVIRPIGTVPEPIPAASLAVGVLFLCLARRRLRTV